MKSEILAEINAYYHDEFRRISLCGLGIRLLWKAFFQTGSAPAKVKLFYSLQPFKGSKAFRIFLDTTINHVYRINLGELSLVILPNQLRKLHPTKKPEDFKRVYLKIEEAK